MQHNRLAGDSLQIFARKDDSVGRGWVARLERKLEHILGRVSALVHQESPTSRYDAVSAAQEMVAGWAEELEGRVERHTRSGSGGVLEARFGNPEDERRPL